MSTTFFVPDSPESTQQVPCDMFCTPEDRCGYCDNGFIEEVVAEAPSLNVSSGETLLETLGFSPEVQGTWEVSDLPNVRRAIVRALSRTLPTFEGYEEQTVHVEGERIVPGCRVIHGGNTADQITRRLETLDKVVRWAQDHQMGVAWG